MANYLVTKFRGQYKMLPDIDMETNDFARDCDDVIDEDMVYISCYYDTKVYYWGLNDSHRGVLVAYIPSKQRARNIKKEMKKQKIDIVDYDESETEAMLKFLASDAEQVIEMLKPYKSGLKTSAFSSKNLPKSNVSIPSEKIEEYKAIISKLGKNDMLVIKNINDHFLTDILEQMLRKKTKNKKFSVRDDMKLNKMSRQMKEYVYARGYWQEYLDYLSKEIDAHYA